MFNNYLNRNLKVGETVLAAVRPSLWSYARQATLALLLIFLPFFFLFPLLRLGKWGLLGFFVSLFIGAIFALRVSVLSVLNVLFVTNQRLVDVDRRGVFSQVVSETTYDKIQDVSFTIKGLWQTLFHYGTVVIQTAGSTANLEVHHVRNPERIHQLIIKAQKEFSSSSGDDENDDDQLSAEELVALMKKLKKGMGEKAFRKLVDKTEE